MAGKGLRFSAKQLRVLTWWRDPRREAVICDGAVRSGKTFAMGLSFFLWAQAEFDGKQFGICGKTIASVRRNLLAELAPALRERQGRLVLVSMAAGLNITDIQEMAGGGYPILRIMPNTPCSIGEGMILYTPGPGVTEEEERIFLEAMAGAGRFSSIPERLMDAGSAVAGCGPAFVDLFVEAMADGGVACGIPRAQALEFAAQMMAGSARLILESGQHPGVLKDAVCSPGGSTIQGVRKLEEAGFRGAVMDAVIAACEKNGNLK